MPDEKLIEEILERLRCRTQSEADLEDLRQLVSYREGADTLQVGKFNVRIDHGESIHIGDRIYHSADADTIRSMLIDVLGFEPGARKVPMPEPKDLEALIEHNRPRIRRECFLLFRRQLCRHFTDLEVAQILKAENKCESREEVPDLFSYLPHTLNERIHDKKADRFHWERINVTNFLGRLSSRSSERLITLVEAPAGFGKSTFLSFVAWRLNVGRRAFALPPTGMLERRGELEPTSRPALIRLLLDRLERPVDWATAKFEAAVQLLLEQGKVVIAVDGLDQVEGAADRMGSYVTSAGYPLRLVASCRQELGIGEASLRWDEVVRLDQPSLEAVSAREMPQVLRATLADAVGPDDVANPFWIHVGRLLLFVKRLPGSDLSTATLLDAYVEELLELGRRRTGQPRDSFALMERQRQAISMVRRVALEALRLKLPDSPAVVQEVPFQVLQLVLEDARSEFPEGGSALDTAQDSHLFFRLVERVSRGGAPVYLFRHQLLQEYLAASELSASVKGLDGVGAVCERLASVVKDVVDPRVIGTGLREGEIMERVRGLAVWQLLAELLGRARDADATAEIIKELNRWVMPGHPVHSQLGQASPCVVAVLMRVRDYLLLDPGVQGLCNAQARLGKPPDDLVWDPFIRLALPPDPFGWLLWAEERQLIAAQVATALAQRQPKELAPWAKTVAWEGNCLCAVDRFDSRWFLVPAGPFISQDEQWRRGGIAGHSELDRSVWVAEDPVLAEDFQIFLKADLAPDAPCWAGLPWELTSAVFDERRSEYEVSRWRTRPRRGRGFPASAVSWILARGYAQWQGFCLGGKHGRL